MTTRSFDRDEQEFLRHIGLEPDALEPLVADAPSPTPEVQSRIRALAVRKIGHSGSAATDPTTPTTAPLRSRNRSHRWFAAAAAILIAVGGTAVVSGSETAQAALQRLLHLVPGFGLTEAGAQTLVLMEPVRVKGQVNQLTVMALFSDGAQTRVRVRVDGLPLDKQKAVGSSGQMQAALVLPDGRRLDLQGATFGGGMGFVQGTIWFAGLPPDVRSVQLELGIVHGMTEPFTALMALADAAAVGLTPAIPGGWADQVWRVRVGAPHIAFEGDRIMLSLDTLASGQGLRVQQIGHDTAPPRLTDDLGNAYALNRAESVLHANSMEQRQAAFAGPVAPDAQSLFLTVLYVQLIGDGKATFRMALGDLPVGERVAVDRTLDLGGHAMRVTGVTRLDQERFQVDLDLGPEQDGLLMQYLVVQPVRNSYQGGGHSSSFELVPDTRGQAHAVELSFPPRGRYLHLEFSRPVFLAEGPWEIALPARPADQQSAR